MSRETWTDTSPLGNRIERPICDWCGVKLYHESTRVRGSGLEANGALHHCDPAVVAERAVARTVATGEGRPVDMDGLLTESAQIQLRLDWKVEPITCSQPFLGETQFAVFRDAEGHLKLIMPREQYKVWDTMLEAKEVSR